METIAGGKTPGLCLLEALPAEVVALGISICDTTRDGSRIVGNTEVIREPFQRFVSWSRNVVPEKYAWGHSTYNASSLEPRIGNSSTDCEVVDHLLRKGARVLARRGPLFVLPELRGARKVLFAGFGNHRSRLAPVLFYAPYRSRFCSLRSFYQKVNHKNTRQP